MRPASIGFLVIALAATGCSIAPRPPEPDPIAATTRQEGQLALPDVAMTAACVWQEMPGSIAMLRQSGAAVRPILAIALPGYRPDYALVLQRQADGPVAWRVLVNDTGSEAGAVAQALDRALANCAARLGGMT
jgi:hypothetical protein